MKRLRKCRCRSCGETLEVGAEWAGRRIQCSACQETTTVVFPENGRDFEAALAGKQGMVGRAVFVAVNGVLAAVIVFCVYSLMQFRAERDDVRLTVARMVEEKAKTEKVFSDTAKEIERLKAENRQLKLTARHFFDRAVEAMNAADAIRNDQADDVAVAAFHDVIRRFPEDPLATDAGRHVDDLKRRKVERAAALQRAQHEVVGHLQQCRAEAAMARTIRKRTLRYNMFDELDPASVSAGNREAEPYDKAAKVARGRAKELLANVPDPGGALAKQIDECSDP